jgi:hypothetical protein
MDDPPACLLNRPRHLLAELARDIELLERRLDGQRHQLDTLRASRHAARGRAGVAKHTLKALGQNELHPAHLWRLVLQAFGDGWQQGRRLSRRRRKLKLRWRLAWRLARRGGLRLLQWLRRWPIRARGAAERLRQGVERLSRRLGQWLNRARREDPPPRPPTPLDRGDQS